MKATWTKADYDLDRFYEVQAYMVTVKAALIDLDDIQAILEGHVIDW